MVSLGNQFPNGNHKAVQNVQLETFGSKIYAPKAENIGRQIHEAIYIYPFIHAMYAVENIYFLFFYLLCGGRVRDSSNPFYLNLLSVAFPLANTFTLAA